MKYCTYCGQELVDEACVCTKCGRSVETVQKKQDKISILLCILLGHVWPAALIYWAVTRSETPRRAKAVAISAFLVPLSWFVLLILLIVLAALLS